MLSPPTTPLSSRATMPAMNTWLPTTSAFDHVWGGGSGTCGLDTRRFFMARLLVVKRRLVCSCSRSARESSRRIFSHGSPTTEPARSDALEILLDVARKIHEVLEPV